MSKSIVNISIKFILANHRDNTMRLQTGWKWKTDKSSLVKICLLSIIRNFDKHCAAFRSHNSTVPRLHYEFLRKLYSNVLIQTMVSKNDHHLELLINEYIKVFDLENFEDCRWELVAEKLIAVGDTIKKLFLLNCKAGFEEMICHFPHVNTLFLSGTLCSDSTLALIGKHCTSLQRLNVSNTQITSQGLMNLILESDNNINNTLLSLSVMNTVVDDECIAFILDQVPLLRFLGYENVPSCFLMCHNISMSQFQTYSWNFDKTYNLTSLDFTKVDLSLLSNLLSLCSDLCPMVEDLTLIVPANCNLGKCCRFSNLEGIRFIGFTNILIDNFFQERVNKLKYIILEGSLVSASSFTNFCPNLETLNLAQTCFFDSGEGCTSALNCLSSFCVETADFTERSSEQSLLAILSASCNLKILQLPNIQTEYTEVPKSLAECIKGLRGIDLSQSEVTFSFIKSVLLSCPSLKKMNISGCYNMNESEYFALLDVAHQMNTIVVCKNDFNDYVSLESDSNDSD